MSDVQQTTDPMAVLKGVTPSTLLQWLVVMANSVNSIADDAIPDEFLEEMARLLKQWSQNEPIVEQIKTTSGGVRLAKLAKDLPKALGKVVPPTEAVVTCPSCGTRGRVEKLDAERLECPKCQYILVKQRGGAKLPVFKTC